MRRGWRELQIEVLLFSRNKFPLGEASPGFFLILNPPFCPPFSPLLTTATQLIPIFFSPRTTFSLHFCPHPSISAQPPHIILRHKQQWQGNCNGSHRTAHYTNTALTTQIIHYSDLTRFSAVCSSPSLRVLASIHR